MSNLSKLYISQSYFGVVNFEDSTKPLSSQSGEVTFQDGLGQSLELSINASTKEYTFNNTVHMNEDLFVSGTIHAYELVTLIESASTILSSGSNQLGDAMDDEQLLIGQTTISGSLTVVGPHSHTGDLDVTGSLFVSNEISSSTIAGLGNATEYSQSVDSSLNILSQSVDNTINTLSQSVDSRLDYLEGPFSTSVDSRLDFIEGPFSTSVDDRLDYLEGEFSTSVDNRLDLIEDYTSSLKTAITVDGTTTNLNGDLNGGTASFDTLNVRTLHTIIESSSVIFSSGSNQLGDELIDTQILSGSVFIPNLEFLNGNLVDTDTRIVSLENFSSSLDSEFVSETELSLYSSSVDTTILALSSSIAITDSNQQIDIDELLLFSASLTADYVTYDYLQTVTSSIYDDIDTKLDTSTFNIYSSSVSAEKADRIGDNIFVGSQIMSGSVNGQVFNVGVSSSTASIDCSLGNFYTLTLPVGDTYLTATNITPGQTITLRVTTQVGNTVNLDDSVIRFGNGTTYVASQNTGTQDVLTFVTFDTSSLYGAVSYIF